ncbi:MAG TPA: chemotaxis response regulator protein-glutamate methylesterase [Candidatus Ozemobacteraceae bacterium]
MKKPIRVLIVDDSAVVRNALIELLRSEEEITVMGVAPDPYIAVQKIAEEIPDVILLDIEMPRMDGLTFLQKIMTQHPIPVVICSSLVGEGCESSLRAFEYGAVEIITKPRLGTRTFLEESRVQICDILKAAAAAKPRKLSPPPSISPKLSADVILEKPGSQAMVQTTEKLIVVGASTGGTEALREFLMALPLDCPAVVIVQHMPEKFTASFAQRLDSLCRVSVKEATSGDTLMRGHVLIAPGNHHMLVKRSGARYYVEIKDGPLVSRHRPSVDVLFRSAARYAGKNAVGVIMTGMGDDGARGMSEMKEAGAITVAQDEATSIVFGMPNEAIKRGGVDHVLPLHRIAREVLRLCGEEK